MRALVSSLTGVCLCAGLVVWAPPVAAHADQQVWVTVTDKAGKPVKDITPGEFALEIEGRTATVLSAAPATEPLAIVVVTEGFTRETVSDARRTLRTAVAGARAAHPDSRVGLLLGDGATAPVMHHVTDDGARLEQEISRFFESSRNTSLLDGVLVAAQTLTTTSTTRRVILAVTCCHDPQADSTSPLKVARVIEQAGASLWAVDAGGAHRPLGSSEGRVLADVTRASGGRQESASLTALATETADVMAQIAGQYLVRFESADHKTSPVVVVRRPGLQVLSPSWPAAVANR